MPRQTPAGQRLFFFVPKIHLTIMRPCKAQGYNGIYTVVAKKIYATLFSDELNRLQCKLASLLPSLTDFFRLHSHFLISVSNFHFLISVSSFPFPSFLVLSLPVFTDRESIPIRYLIGGYQGYPVWNVIFYVQLCI